MGSSVSISKDGAFVVVGGSGKQAKQIGQVNVANIKIVFGSVDSLQLKQIREASAFNLLVHWINEIDMTKLTFRWYDDEQSVSGGKLVAYFDGSEIAFVGTEGDDNTATHSERGAANIAKGFTSKQTPKKAMTTGASIFMREVKKEFSNKFRFKTIDAHE